jgi:hypothetical protein
MDDGQSIARDLSDLRVAVARIEEHLVAIVDQLAEVEDLDGRLTEVERSANWVKAWSAGAFAAVVAVFGALSWIAANLPHAIAEVAK